MTSQLDDEVATFVREVGRRLTGRLVQYVSEMEVDRCAFIASLATDRLLAGAHAFQRLVALGFEPVGFPRPAPPLGVIPEWLWLEGHARPSLDQVCERAAALEAAIRRYRTACVEPLPEWLDELARRRREGLRPPAD